MKDGQNGEKEDFLIYLFTGESVYVVQASLKLTYMSPSLKLPSLLLVPPEC